MNEWYLVEPVELESFNKFETIDKIKEDISKKQSKYLSLLLDGKEVK